MALARQHQLMEKRSQTTKMRAERWSRERACAALAEWRASGLSIAAFARNIGVHPQRLRNWVTRLRAPSGAPTAEFVEIQRGPAHRADAAIEIMLPSGVVLRVRETVDVEALRRITGVLAGGAQC